MAQSLEDLLAHANLITQTQLAQAQRESETHHRPLPQTLINLGFVTDQQFAKWLSETTKLPLVDPLSADAVGDVVQYLTRAVAREYEALPIDVNGDEMTVAMMNPLDEGCRNALHAATGLKIRAVVGVHEQLKELVDRFYPADAPTAGAFDPSSTMIAAPAAEPFQFGTETLLRSQATPLEFERAEESVGVETRAVPMSEVMASETQLDRIERQLGELTRVIDGLQRRIEAIDTTLARVLARK